MKHAVLSARLLAEQIARGEHARYSRTHRRLFRRQRLLGLAAGRLYDSPFQRLLLPILKSERAFLLLYGWLHA
jgi:hypothetical protein